MAFTKSKDKSSKPEVGFSRKWSYISAIVAVTSHLGWYISSQIIGIAYPTFELNTLRFITQVSFCVIVVCYNKQSIRPKSVCDFFYLSLSSTAYAISIITSYLGTLYLPTGNLKGVSTSLFILLNVLVSFCGRKVNFVVTTAAALAIIGTICIVQPDFLFGTHMQRVKTAECPCATMIPSSNKEQCGKSLESYLNESESSMYSIKNDEIYIANGSISFFVTTESSSNIYSENNTIRIKKNHMGNGNILSSFIHNEAHAYVLPAMTAMLFFICIQINARSLLPIYHHSVISLWNGLFGVLFSGFFMVSAETLYFNMIALCVLLLIIHCVLSSTVMIFCNIAWVHVRPEEYAVLETIGLALLFIAQSTFLRNIHPPHGNLPEVLGAILIICACLLEPFVVICKKVCKKNQIELEDIQPNEHTPLLKEQVNYQDMPIEDKMGANDGKSEPEQEEKTPANINRRN